SVGRHFWPRSRDGAPPGRPGCSASPSSAGRLAGPAELRNGPVMRTYQAKPAEALPARKWWIVDAADQPLGRVASRVATVLRGKHKPTFTPHVDTGDFVIVINADKVKVTGNKAHQKQYFTHSGV